MAPLGLRDREAGTLTLTTSLGLWKKLDRVRRKPGVAVAYHAREHGFSDRPGFVLVQGRASFSPTPDRAWLESIEHDWNRFLVPRSRGALGRALDVYYWQRVAIDIEVLRVVAYPDGAALRDPDVFGAEHPSPPAAREAPSGGTGPRVSVDSAVAHAKRLPHTLLGWCGADDLPDVVPVSAAHPDADGMRLDVPPGSVPGCRARSSSTTLAAPASRGGCEARGRPGSSGVEETVYLWVRLADRLYRARAANMSQSTTSVAFMPFAS
jgi:hypothetical protein